jgi:hypothetical protein
LTRNPTINVLLNEKVLGGHMMDQNTTTIIASAIAVLGTLGGAIAGVLLSNRHASKMEKLRIEQEKVKRDSAVIEEVYTLLTRIENQIYRKVGNSDLPEIRNDDIDRVRTLIYLYLPSVKQKFDELSESIFHLTIALANGQETKEKYDEAHKKFQSFSKRFKSLQSSLEKMVK